MQKRTWLITHSIISLAFFATFAYTSIKDVLSIGTYYIWIICYSVPAIIILVLLVSSYSFLNESYITPLRYFPIATNFLTTIFAVIAVIISSAFDLTFLVHQKEFSQVVQLVNDFELSEREYGRENLPAMYQHLSVNNDIIVIRNNEKLSIMFFEGIESSDGLSWGYLYSSEADNPIDDEWSKCVEWRKLRPNIQHWFYCEYFHTRFGL